MSSGMELTEVEVILRAKGDELYRDFKRLVRESGYTGKQAGQELEKGMVDGIKDAVAEMPKEIRDAAPQVEREARAMAKKAASAIQQEFERRMRQEDRYRKMGEKIGNDIRQGIDRAGTSLTIGVTLPAIAGMRTAINAARDLTEAQNKANVVFGKSIPIVQEFGKTSADAYGISTRAANEYAATFGEILKGTKLTQPALAQMSVELTKLAGDIASFHNLTIEQSLEKLRSGLVGEVEPLRTVGVLLSDNAVKAKALALGYKGKADALSDSAKMLIRYQLILEQTKSAQGDMSRTSDEAANKERRLKAEVENLASTFGKDLMPVYKDVLKTGLDIVHSFQALDPEVRKGIIQWGAYAAAMGPVLKTLTGIFSMIGGIVKMSGSFADAMKGITAAGTGGAAVAAGGSVAALGAALHFGFKPMIDAIHESDKRMATLQGQSMREISAGLRMGKSKDQLFKEYLAFKRTTEGPGFERDPAKNNFNLYYGEARRDAVMRIATQIAWDDPNRRKAIQDAGGMPQFGEGDMQGYLKSSATFRTLYKEAEAALKKQKEATSSTFDLTKAIKDALSQSGAVDGSKKKSGPGPDNQQWKQLVRSVMGEIGNLKVTSEFRPGAKTRGSGYTKDSLHATNQALDIAGTPEKMALLFDSIRRMIGDSNIRELIYSPRGIVKNGRFSPVVRNEKTRADHYNHVHVSLRPGAYGSDVVDNVSNDPKLQAILQQMSMKATGMKLMQDQIEDFRRSIQLWGKDGSLAAKEFDVLNQKIEGTNLTLGKLIELDPQLRAKFEEWRKEAKRLQQIDLEDKVTKAFAEAGKEMQASLAEKAAADAEWARGFLKSLEMQDEVLTKAQQLAKELEGKSLPLFLRRLMERQAKRFDDAQFGGNMANEMAGGILGIRDLATQMGQWGQRRQGVLNDFYGGLDRESVGRWGNKAQQEAMWKAEQLSRLRYDLEQVGVTSKDMAARLGEADSALTAFLKKDEAMARLREQMDGLRGIIDNGFGQFLDNMLNDGRNFTSHFLSLFTNMATEIGKQFLRMQLMRASSWLTGQIFGAAGAAFGAGNVAGAAVAGAGNSAIAGLGGSVVVNVTGVRNEGDLKRTAHQIGLAAAQGAARSARRQ